jgi:hypothetical protein
MAGLISKNMQTPEGEMEPKLPGDPTSPDDSMPHENAEPKAFESQEKAAEGEVDAENDPTYRAALKYAMQALYKNGGAEGLAKVLRGAQEPSKGLADAAYNIVSIVDEQTQGAIPDEMLAPFAVQILQEVVDIANSAGVQVRDEDIGLALKEMILRYLGENGVDTTQLQQAMDQVNPSDIVAQASSGDMPGMGEGGE